MSARPQATILGGGFAGLESAFYLVVATGADMRPDEVPGLAEYSHNIWTPEAMLELRPALEELVQAARAKQNRQLLFVIPPNNRCSGPLYEMAMMIVTWLRRAGARDWAPGSKAASSDDWGEITWTTYEARFLQAFGPRLHTVVSQEFQERGIRGFCGQVVSHVEPEKVHYRNGIVREFDLPIAFPPYVAGTRFPGLPSDDRGFVHVDPESRQVTGSPDVFAVGDAADFPIKQAFLALLQGDAAAEHLAADIEGREPEFGFEPMSMCVMEELHKATFAQVPLRYTGDSARPVEADTEDAEHYKVGVSPLWRVGKTALGLYLPWRFGRGEPFHAGAAWEAMDLGLKVMAKALAR